VEDGEMSRFHIGQKVVCIVDYSSMLQEEWAQLFDADVPLKGGVYTVRSVTLRPYGDDECYGILLEEVINLQTNLDGSGKGGYVAEDDPNIIGVGEMAFLEDDFRPLITVSDFVEVRQRVNA
jgi:hypothetical protein